MMKNPILILIVLLVISVFGFGAYTLYQNSPQSDSMKNSETMMQKDELQMNPTDVMMKKDDSMMEDTRMTADTMNGSRYVQYSKSVVSSVSGNRRVLFFYASWCPTCKAADANFTQNVNSIPEDVTLIRVNYNDPDTDQEEKDLAKQYGITYQHTFVQIDNAGNEVTKWNSGQIDELLSKMK